MGLHPHNAGQIVEHLLQDMKRCPLLASFNNPVCAMTAHAIVGERCHFLYDVIPSPTCLCLICQPVEALMGLESELEESFRNPFLEFRISGPLHSGNPGRSFDRAHIVGCQAVQDAPDGPEHLPHLGQDLVALGSGEGDSLARISGGFARRSPCKSRPIRERDHSHYQDASDDQPCSHDDLPRLSGQIHPCPSCARTAKARWPVLFRGYTATAFGWLERGAGPWGLNPDGVLRPDSELVPVDPAVANGEHHSAVSSTGDRALG